MQVVDLGEGHVRDDRSSHAPLRLQMEYRFEQSGAVCVDVRVDASTFMPRRLQGELNSLPRIGFEFTLPKALQRCVWYGRCDLCVRCCIHARSSMHLS